MIPIPRHRVSWRLIGKNGGAAHAVVLLERGRLAWESLCGRKSAGSRQANAERECGKCAEQVEPLVRVA